MVLFIQVIGFTFFPKILNAQLTFNDSIFFSQGKSTLSQSDREQIEKFLTQLSSIRYYEIVVTGFRDTKEEQKLRSVLAELRVNEVCKVLIGHNQGAKISEIRITLIDSVLTNLYPETKFTGLVDICITETFPKPEFTGSMMNESEQFQVENDSVITTSNGTIIKIQGGSFKPYKISDYLFEIKELFSASEIAYNNMNTLTNRRELINASIILSFWISSKDPLIPVPGRILKPVIFLIPTEVDSLTTSSLLLFRNSDGKKFFPEWRESDEPVNYQYYNNQNHVMISTSWPGYCMVGRRTTSCKCCLIKFPVYYRQKLKILYEHQNALISLDDKNLKWYQLPCPEGNEPFSLVGFASSKSGQLYSVNQTLQFPSKKSPGKKHAENLFRIKRDEYKRM